MSVRKRPASAERLTRDTRAPNHQLMLAPTTFNGLPPELFPHIFTHLASHRAVLRCRAVCMHWNRLILEDLFVQGLLLPCRRNTCAWQGSATAPGSMAEDRYPHPDQLQGLDEWTEGMEVRKGMIANGAEAWTCGTVTVPRDVVVGVGTRHPGMCARSGGGWYDLLVELAFVEYLGLLIGPEVTVPNVRPEFGSYSFRPVLLGSAASVELLDNEQVDEALFRTATSNTYTTEVPISVERCILPSATCGDFAHICYDIAKWSAAPPECHPWATIRSRAKNQTPSTSSAHQQADNELCRADPTLFNTLGRAHQNSVLIMPALRTAFRRLEEFGGRMYVVHAPNDVDGVFPKTLLDKFYLVQSPRTGRLVGLGTYIDREGLPDVLMDGRRPGRCGNVS
ncbi:hypothetical protein HDU88_006446 [Geranomyces variabilis]|nr:hypothetical protein HDU88_006446 [Geranomyces variabilis]